MPPSHVEKATYISHQATIKTYLHHLKRRSKHTPTTLATATKQNQTPEQHYPPLVHRHKKQEKYVATVGKEHITSSAPSPFLPF